MFLECKTICPCSETNTPTPPTCYTVAYAVMQIPSNIIVQYIRPSYWLALMEVCWGTFTFAQAGVQNSTQLYAFRFMVGFFESSFFPVLLFVLGTVLTFYSYTWANEVCAGDNEERAITISSINGFQYAVAAWLLIVIFPQTMAPSFRYGFPGTFGLALAALVAVLAIQFLHRRELECDRGRVSTGDTEEGSHGCVDRTKEPVTTSVLPTKE